MSHPSTKCTHEENRQKLCAPCGKKILFGKKKPERFLINARQEKLIQDCYNSDFSLTDSKYPISICSTCRNTNLEHEKGNFKRPLQKMPNYGDMILPNVTRNNNCECYICLIGRNHPGTLVIEKGRGHVRNLSNQINQFNGLNGNSKNNINSFPKKQDLKTIQKNSLTLCSTCYQEIGRGKSHQCGSPAKACGNVKNLFEKLPEKQQEQIVSSVVKRKISGAAEILEAENKNHTYSYNRDHLLSTGGPKMRILVKSKKIESETTFSSESLKNFQVNTGISDNTMKKTLNFLRCNVGRKSVPAYYEAQMAKNSKILEDIYKEEVLEFDVKNCVIKKKRPVIYADAEELLDCIITKRNFIGNVNVKVMADGGQGFFKISMSVLPDDNEIQENNLKRRHLYSEGGTTGQKGMLTSVNRLIMLCTVPQIEETYDNVKILFDLTKLNNIPFKFASDFKLLLIVNGQQTASASFPCPYCFVPLTNLRNKKEDEIVCDYSDDCGCPVHEVSSELKTYGHLKKDYDKFCSLGAKKKLAKKCHSTVNPPLFIEDDDVCVIQKCVIPELHILQGFVNHLFWNGLVNLLGKEKALLWPSKMGLLPKEYQGEIFEGNACRKLLKEADRLNDPEIYGNLGPLRITPFISAFKVMDKIVNLYFSTRKIDTNDANEIDKHVNDLRKSFQATEVSESLKIHVVLQHLSDCLQFLNGDGLGKWSEQSGESIHRVFLDQFWNKYKINKIDHESYSKRLKQAVVEFSSKHI